MPTLSSMLPTAGLFLPETLHRADLPTQVPTEGEGTRLKYFQRMYGRPKQEATRNSENRRPSTAIPMETPDDVSRDFPSVPTTFGFAVYVLGSDKASSEILSFASLIQQVRQGIDEATRLYLSSAVSNFLDAYPGKRTWIEHTFREVRRALNDIGMDMDNDGGTVASKREFEWGLKNQKRLLKRQQQLSNCHTQLTGAIYVMQTAELCGKSGTIVQEPIFEAPVRPWVPVDEKDVLRGPYSRQKHRASHTNLSMSNVTLSSEVEKDNFETSSVNSIPVELAGSTPADLEPSESYSMRTFLSPQVSREFTPEHSTLLRRPRARSDYFRPATSRDTRSRRSFDTAVSSSKPADTTIERNDSTMSTTATVCVPMVARRHRATSVDIQRHGEKHRSLPSELPYLKSQPSLIDDLADYVLPSAASEGLPRRAWAASPTSSVPSISVTSSPTIGHTLPSVLEATSDTDRNVSQSMSQPVVKYNDTPGRPAPPQQQDSTETLAPTRNQEDLVLWRANSIGPERTSSPQSAHSSMLTPLSPTSLVNVSNFVDEEPIRRPSSQRPSQRLSKRMSHTSSSRSYIASPSPTVATIAEPTPLSVSTEKEVVSQEAVPAPVPPPSPRTVTDDASQLIPASSTEVAEELGDDDVVLSVLRQRLRKQNNVKKMAEDLVRAKDTGESTPTEGQSPVTKTEDQPTITAAGNSLPQTTSTTPVREDTSSVPSKRSQVSLASKPMSAQAKRREATRRRMQLAFSESA